MTFVQRTTPDRRVHVTCIRCHETKDFVHADAAIGMWKKTHACPRPERPGGEAA